MKVLDSRGETTIRCKINYGKNTTYADAPAGKSKSKYEGKASKNLDEDIDVFTKAVNVGLRGMNMQNQQQIDGVLSKIDQERKYTMFTISTSIAVCKASSNHLSIPIHEYVSNKFNTKKNMPKIMVNIINGGMHANSSVSLQEFMIIPKNKDLTNDIWEAKSIFGNLKGLFNENNLPVVIGDEGGLVLSNGDSQKAVDLIKQASNEKCDIAIDFASSSFFIDDALGGGMFSVDGKAMNPKEYYSFVEDFVHKNNIKSVEDQFPEDKNDLWESFMNGAGKNIMVVGDDIFATSKDRLMKFRGCANAIIIKPDQIGTLSAAVETIKLAKTYGYNVVVSHRSGETSDDFIADFSVGVGADFVKFGSVCRGERVSKYNRLMEIHQFET